MVATQLNQTDRPRPQDRRPRICLPPPFRAPPPLACTVEGVRANRSSAGGGASYHADWTSIVPWSQSELPSICAASDELVIVTGGIGNGCVAGCWRRVRGQ